MTDADTAEAPVVPSGRRRSYGLALLLLAAGGAGLVLAYGMPWGFAEVPLVAGVEGSTRSVAFTGRDLFPAAAFAGWVCIAGIAGVVATRSWGRVLVAIAMLATGLVAAAAAVFFAASPSPRLDSAVDALIGTDVTSFAEPTPWWIAAVLAGCAAVTASAWTAVRGRHWPVLGSRYERASGPGRELSAWQAQDLGQDPTDDLVE